MARIGIDYDTVKHAAIKLLSQGIAPSVQKIREELGTGSNTTIAEHLKTWREEYAKKAIHHLPANMPKELISSIEVLWQTAMEQAQNQLADYKQSIEIKCEAALQKERDTERSMADIQQRIAEISATLEQEITIKQKLNIELAVTNERLIKQDEAINTQKDQYEDRLEQIYEEKDMAIMQCRQLQNEVKSLQDRVSLQTEQHQNAIAQQNVLHEQSENRWAKMIDRAKEETKDADKKLENLRAASNIENTKLKATISDFQQSLLEKNAQLKVDLERMNQLKQDIKFLESEIIKARTIVMRLEEDLKLKDIAISETVKNKREKITQQRIKTGHDKKVSA